MNNYSYTEGFTIPNKKISKKNKTVIISDKVIASRNYHETTLFGFKEPTQVSLYPPE